MKRILVVEDEFSINDVLTFSLEEEGYEVKGVMNGADARSAMLTFKPDLVLLDVMLPDANGFDLCEEFTEFAYVIMVTALGEVVDKIKGINIGADDYIAKPFEIEEVLARVKAVFRRAEVKVKKQSSGLVINEVERKAIYNGVELDLKRKEYELLSFLNSNKNIVFSRDTLLDRVWGMDYEGEERTVDVHIRRVRAKLNEGKEDSIIETVFGVGYVMRW